MKKFRYTQWDVCKVGNGSFRRNFGLKDMLVKLAKTHLPVIQSLYLPLIRTVFKKVQ